MKLLACVFVAILAIQGITARNTNFNTEHAHAYNAIDDIINKLKEIIQIAKDKIQQFIEDIKDLIPSIINKIENKVFEEIKKIKDEIEKILNNAINAGKDVTDCILQSQEEIEKLKETVINEGKECVENVKDVANEVINKIKAEIKNIDDEVAQIVNDVKACNGSLTCIWKEKEKVLDLVKEVGQITKLVAELWTSIVNESTDCVENVGKEVISQGKDITQNIINCVNNK